MTLLSALTETEEEQKKRLAEICGKVIDIDEGAAKAGIVRMRKAPGSAE